MKAFRYLTALGLGAAVSLGEAVSPPTAQAQTADPAETTALVAVNLVPEAEVAEAEVAEAETAEEAITEEAAVQEAAVEIDVIEASIEAEQGNATASAAAVEPSESSLNPEQVTESIGGLVATAPVVELAQAIAPAEATQDSPEISETLAQEATVVERSEVLPEVERSDVTEAVAEELAQTSEETVPVEESTDPIEQEFLGEPTVEQAEEAPAESVSVDGAVESAPKGTSLIDDQPNLLRPSNADDVVVETAENITLEQAIEIARQNNPTIRIRQLEVDRAQASVDQARAALSPQITTNAGLSQNGTAVRAQQLYNEAENAAGDSINNNETDTKTRTQTTGLSGNVRLDYSIIQPGRRAQIRVAEKQKEQAELTLNQDLAQLRLDVSTEYYAVQEADEQVKISASAVESALKSLQDAQALERAGVGTRFAVLQAEVQLANEEQNRINAISSQNQTRRILAQRLSIPENFGVASADTVQAAGQWDRSLEDSIILAYQNRVELDSQLLGREINDFQREVALAPNRPTLGLFAQVGPQFAFQDQRVSDNDDSDASSRVGTRSNQLEYTVGLNFQWRFFDGGGTKAAARQSELNKAIAEEQFESVRDGVRQQVENAFFSLQANFNNISTAKKGVQQAASALRLARLRFQAGVGTQSEVVDAERDLTTARGNEVTAILNYNRALVQMRRATGETLAAPAYESPVYEAPTDSDR